MPPISACSSWVLAVWSDQTRRTVCAPASVLQHVACPCSASFVCWLMQRTHAGERFHGSWHYEPLISVPCRSAGRPPVFRWPLLFFSHGLRRPRWIGRRRTRAEVSCHHRRSNLTQGPGAFAGRRSLASTRCTWSRLRHLDDDSHGPVYNRLESTVERLGRRRPCNDCSWRRSIPGSSICRSRPTTLLFTCFGLR